MCALEQSEKGMEFNMKKNNSGITLMVLIITIIVLLIIASISVYEGKELIAKSKVQTLETNMLTIQAKAKAYAEEIDAKIWTESNKDSARNTEFLNKGFKNPTTTIDSKYKSINSTNYIAYEVTGDALTNMGLDSIKNEEYIVIYDKDDYKKMDVIYPEGVVYNKIQYYALSDLQSALND